jgi:hypothetical protein
MGFQQLMPRSTFIFECSTATYLDCVQKNLFGSNLPWPLKIKKGDFCCLYHYEVSTLFALWQATTDGGRNLVPKAWGGRFPFQVKVSLATPEIVEIAKATVPEAPLNPATGKFDNALEEPRADQLLKLVQQVAGHRT